jgi:UDP-glucose 4-epimerase
LITWTIGAGGLLGRAITRRLPAGFDPGPIAWGEPARAAAQLSAAAAQFVDAAGEGRWAVIWAAGNAATASTEHDAAAELATFTALVDAIAQARPRGHGAFFLSSSAGGVYAGSTSPPFDATTPPQPLSPYGSLKLAQEALVRERLAGTCSVVIGRIANLYGPGQNLEKLQGLISRLALATVTKQSINMFVSLDTMRDYIYCDDAAAVIVHWVQRAIDSPTPDARIVVVASGQPVSLGYLIHLVQDIARTRIPVAFGVHASSTAQARDLRLNPTTDADVIRLIATPLAAGVKLTYLDILERYQRQLS